MIVAIVILLISCFVLCWIGAFCESHKLRLLMCFIAGIFLLLTSSLITAYLQTTPTAMDVYQGKTELEYTVKNDKIIDSVVVFKNK